VVYNFSMFYTTIISPQILARHLSEPGWGIFDCRFSLADKEGGRKAYRQAHIPGAVYVHLEEDLSAPVIPGKTGRHPLPPPQQVASTFSRLGIARDMQIVAYDDAGGALAAARLWWMARWMGLQNCAVLDGGWQAWQTAFLPVRSGEERLPPTRFNADPHPELLATAEDVDAIRLDPGWKVLDARSADRYRGKNETIDPVAGHIPGAISAPYADNLTTEGLMLPVADLRAMYRKLLGEVPADHTIVYCGSGVTAAHSLLAIQHAGLGEAKLYCGSWSDWITDPKRSTETG
jgi:thiosulfate/3-mercaptopyruvate sulfurtransferase